MTLWTAAEAEAATGGRSTRPWDATGVSIDSREIRPGDLFVALKDVRDGHDFVADALAGGAAAAMVSRRPEDVPGGAPLLLVPDVLEALGALGRAGRARSAARVIAVTGSVGKTSTKEMLRVMLEGAGAVHAAERSFNNHWGVPLTLARLPPDARFAVLEIGMNAPGEIAPLSRMARPHVAMITTVGAAHLEALGSLEAIAREKASVFEGLEPGGFAVFDGDLDTSPILAAAAKDAGAQAVRFGTGPGNGYRLTEARVVGQTTVVEGRARRTPVLFKLRTAGAHFAKNAMGALAVVGAVEGDTARALCALGNWTPPDGRGLRQRILLDIVDDHLAFDLIDDAFNANPASMAAALDVLAAAEPRDGVGRVEAGRRIAVLGDMLELGPGDRELHAALARHPAMAAVATVHCVGPRMRALWDQLPDERRGMWVEEAGEIAGQVHHLVDAGDVVLVKGSKSSLVSRVVDAFRKLGHPAPDDPRGTD